MRINPDSHASDMEAISSTGFSANDDLEAAQHFEQTSVCSTLPELLIPTSHDEIDPDDFEYPEPCFSPQSSISPEDYWHNPTRSQVEVSIFKRFIRYIKRQCHGIVAKVVRKFTAKTRFSSPQSPIATIMTERQIETVVSITAHEKMRLRPTFMESGQTIEEVLNTVLPASVLRENLTREDIANALVDSLTLENVMGYDQRFKEMGLAPSAPVYEPSDRARASTSVTHGYLHEIMTTDTCITNVETVTPITTAQAPKTTRLRWLTGAPRPTSQGSFGAQLLTVADPVAGFQLG
ncbi:hypothetical protein DFP73DRAFT_598261 [Morchella snyderi]|nr:hypothetical protein DFP73DRAFT_598261 [Morchella snyderi]